MGRKSTLPAIVAALEVATAGLTQIDLQRITGASAGSVHMHIHALHDAGRVYIASWKTDAAGKINGGVYQARYRLGKGADMPKPPALTPAEIHRRKMARVRAEPGALKDLRAQWAEMEKRRYWKVKPARRDPMVAALFGMGA